MSLSDLANIGSFISGIAVLISLIYLAVQIRQASKHTLAAMHEARAAAINTYLQPLASDPVLLDVVLRGNAGDPSLDRIEAGVISTSGLPSCRDMRSSSISTGTAQSTRPTIRASST